MFLGLKIQYLLQGGGMVPEHGGRCGRRVQASRPARPSEQSAGRVAAQNGNP